MRTYAKLARTALRWGALVAFVGSFQIANAAYIMPSDPGGFSRGPGGFSYRPNKATDLVFKGGVWTPAGPFALGNRLPAAYKFGALARRAAAGAIFAHPATRTISSIATWLGLAKMAWDFDKWVTELDADKSTGAEYNVRDQGWMTTPEAACKAWVTFLQGARPNDSISYSKVDLSAGHCVFTLNGSEVRESLSQRGSSCPTDWYIHDGKCTKDKPQQQVSEEDFKDRLQQKEMPDRVPLDIPFATDFPIDLPSPWINPEPGPNPQNRALRIPTGEPVPVPNTTPQVYRHPYTDIIPAPTPSEPWRLQVIPGERITIDKTPLPYPDYSKPQPNLPAPTPSPTDPNASDKPTDGKDQSLCERHPGILACTELDVPDGQIPKTEKRITYQEEDTFGSGSCPADIYMDLRGQNVKVYDWQQTCSVVTTYLRPLILLLGAMGALFILIPGRDA